MFNYFALILLLIETDARLTIFMEKMMMITCHWTHLKDTKTHTQTHTWLNLAFSFPENSQNCGKNWKILTWIMEPRNSTSNTRKFWKIILTKECFLTILKNFRKIVSPFTFAPLINKLVYTTQNRRSPRNLN